jgi:hypothetical protein
MHHGPSALQSTYTHTLLNIAHEQLVLESLDRLLEGPTLLLEATISVNFGDQRSITDVAKCLIHTVMPHIVSVQKPKDIGSNKRWGNVDVVDGSSVNFAVVGGTF